MNKSEIIKIKWRRIKWYFICECCGAEGELVSPKKKFNFGCPAGCGGNYFQWENPLKNNWDLTCVAGPVFTEEAK